MGQSSENTRGKDTPSSLFHSIGEINVEAGPEQRGTEWQGRQVRGSGVKGC